MGFFKKFIQILTCGVGSWLWQKVRQRIGFAKWTLRWQIFCSVSCSLFCVLIILITVILVSKFFSFCDLGKSEAPGGLHL